MSFLALSLLDFFLEGVTPCQKAALSPATFCKYLQPEWEGIDKNFPYQLPFVDMISHPIFTNPQLNSLDRRPLPNDLPRAEQLQ